MDTLLGYMFATLYYAIHKLSIPAHLQLCFAMYKRYVDDGIGIWIGPTVLWTEFKMWVNSFGSLHWIFTK
jgi:hypothetical protein